MKLMI